MQKINIQGKKSVSITLRNHLDIPMNIQYEDYKYLPGRIEVIGVTLYIVQYIQDDEVEDIDYNAEIRSTLDVTIAIDNNEVLETKYEIIDHYLSNINPLSYIEDDYIDELKESIQEQHHESDIFETSAEVGDI